MKSFNSIRNPYLHIQYSLDDYPEYDDKNKELFKYYIVNNFEYKHYLYFSETLESYTLPEYLELNFWLTQQFNKKFDIRHIIKLEKQFISVNPLDNLLFYIKKYYENIDNIGTKKIIKKLASDLDRYYKREITYALNQLKSQNDLKGKLNFIDSLSMFYYEKDKSKSVTCLQRNIQLAKDKYGTAYMNHLMPLLDLIKRNSTLNYIPLITYDVKGNLSFNKRITFKELDELCYNSKYDPSETIIKQENIIKEGKVIKAKSKFKKVIHLFFRDCNQNGVYNQIDLSKVDIFYNTLVGNSNGYSSSYNLREELNSFFKTNPPVIKDSFIELFILLMDCNYIVNSSTNISNALSNYFYDVKGMSQSSIEKKLCSKNLKIGFPNDFIAQVKTIEN